MKNKQIKEAVKRIKIINSHSKYLCEDIVESFVNKNIVNRTLRGIFTKLSDNEEDMIKKWEKKSNNLVYGVCRKNTEFGELLTILYVSQHEDEWEFDREDLEHEVPIAYVFNLDYPAFSEYGSVFLGDYYM